MTPRFQAVADHALLVSVADVIGDDAHATIVSLDRALASDAPEGLIETIPALVNLLVTFDLCVTDHATIQAHLDGLLRTLDKQAAAGTERRVHVCYDAPFSPDLDAVADAVGMPTEAVIDAHLSGDYNVLMYGFAPGYAYMSGVAQPIQVPRKPTPLRDVPAGSVIIAGPQCLVTTLTMPTGWSIIGRSPTPILTGDTRRPFLFDVGDRVVFERIDRATFDRLSTERAHG